jgi:hypothetical protein
MYKDYTSNALLLMIKDLSLLFIMLKHNMDYRNALSNLELG